MVGVVVAAGRCGGCGGCGGSRGMGDAGRWLSRLPRLAGSTEGGHHPRAGLRRGNRCGARANASWKRSCASRSARATASRVPGPEHRRGRPCGTGAWTCHQPGVSNGGLEVTISVARIENDDALRWEVTDDGPGFDPSDTTEGTGLQNMHDRLGALGGRVSIITAPGEGTTVSGSVPLTDLDTISA
jgi:hypothetical protein